MQTQSFLARVWSSAFPLRVGAAGRLWAEMSHTLTEGLRRPLAAAEKAVQQTGVEERGAGLLLLPKPEAGLG